MNVSSAQLEARVTGTLTPLNAALLCERVERREEATVEDVRALFATADHLADQVEEYRHALRVLAAHLKVRGAMGSRSRSDGGTRRCGDAVILVADTDMRGSHVRVFVPEQGDGEYSVPVAGVVKVQQPARKDAESLATGLMASYLVLRRGEHIVDEYGNVLARPYVHVAERDGGYALVSFASYTPVEEITGGVRQTRVGRASRTLIYQCVVERLVGQP